MSADIDLCYEANTTVAFMLHRVRQANLHPVSVTMPQQNFDALTDYAERNKVDDPDSVSIPIGPLFMGLPVRVGDRFEIGVTA